MHGQSLILCLKLGCLLFSRLGWHCKSMLNCIICNEKSCVISELYNHPYAEIWHWTLYLIMIHLWKSAPILNWAGLLCSVAKLRFSLCFGTVWNADRFVNVFVFFKAIKSCIFKSQTSLEWLVMNHVFFNNSTQFTFSRLIPFTFPFTFTALP